MRYSVNIPSYRRLKVQTLEYMPIAKVWVDGSEAEHYRKWNPGAEIVECPDGVQGNVSRVRNHILKAEFGAGMDAVVFMDDDMRHIAYYESIGRYGYNDRMLRFEDFDDFVQNYTQMAVDLGAYLWGVNVNTDASAYDHFKPFNTRMVILGPFSVHIRGGDVWYDERLPLKEDYDLSLQHLNKHRAILRLNKYHYLCKQSKNEGGCAVYRSMEREQAQFNLLVKKWGPEIVRLDKREHEKQRSDVLDYNPIIKVPIKGV